MAAHQHPDTYSGRSLSVALHGIADRIDGDLTAMAGDELRALLLDAVTLQSRLDARLARIAGVFDANVVWAGDGARSTGSWLAARRAITAPFGNALAYTGRDLRACPALDDAWSDGRVTSRVAQLLLKARERNPDLFARDEAVLIDAVEPLTLAHAKAVISRWAALAEATLDAQRREDAGLDPDDARGEPPTDPAADNALHLSPVGDRVVGDLDLDPVSGAEVIAAVEALIARWFHDGTYRADDGLTAAKRRAEALVELVRRGTEASTTQGDPRPSVSITIDAKTLQGIPVDDVDDLLARACNLDDGTPILRSTAERLLCSARIATALECLGPEGTLETLGITDHLRDATARQRKALARRDGGCVFPGCAAPPKWCQAHHIEHFGPHGPTLLRNLVLLCSFHHHLVHEGRWALWRHVGDGHLRLRKPDGTPVPMTRHGTLITDHPPGGIGPVDPAGQDPGPPRPPPEPRFRTVAEGQRSA